MLLAICIPTHQGRRDTLAELLESIAVQASGLGDRLEVCVSDNASQDGTEEMVRRRQAHFPVPLRYSRFDTDRGVANFFNVVDMARSEYCWIIGSDDALVEGSLRRVVQLLDVNPAIGGLTLNKFNFDNLLETPIGTDHPIVLPVDWTVSREIRGYDEIAGNFFFLFLFLSAQVFRRDLWLDGVASMSRDEISHFRHFVHSFLYLHIARKNARWLWHSIPLVVQRLGNSCVLEEEGNSGLEYAIQVSEDTLKFAAYAFAEEPARIQAVRRKLYFIYWNPLSVASYKNGAQGSLRGDVRILNFSISHFRREPVFWLTGIWLTLTPYFLLRPPFRLARRLYLRLRKDDKERGAGVRGGIFAYLMRIFGVGGYENSAAGQCADALLEDSLTRFLAANRNRLGILLPRKAEGAP
jgi:abequosyltransferase